MVDLSKVVCKRLPEGNTNPIGPSWHGAGGRLKGGHHQTASGQPMGCGCPTEPAGKARCGNPKVWCFHVFPSLFHSCFYRCFLLVSKFRNVNAEWSCLSACFDIDVQ